MKKRVVLPGLNLAERLRQRFQGDADAARNKRRGKGRLRHQEATETLQVFGTVFGPGGQRQQMRPFHGDGGLHAGKSALQRSRQLVALFRGDAA